MLNPAKKSAMLASVKDYRKKFLFNKTQELDESGTRLMINHFLTDILGYESLEEIKTEYMIRGTYADYVVQTKGTRHFLVEVKALSLNLSDKHLRQAINYGANEGIEWALLTNGRSFELYKIIFDKPIDYKKVWTIDLMEIEGVKASLEQLEFLHCDAVNKKSLDELWNRHSALDPYTLGGLLYSESIIGFIKKELKKKYNCKFEDEDLKQGLNALLCSQIALDKIKISKVKVKKKIIVSKNLVLLNTSVTSEEVKFSNENIDI